MMAMMHMSQNFFVFFAITCSEFFLTFTLSFFSVFLLPLPFAFHILSGCRKTLGFNYGQTIEIGSWSVIDRPFYHHFAPKLIPFFYLLRQNTVEIQNWLLCEYVTLALTAYQEYPVTFQLMTTQVVLKARPLSTRICAVGSLIKYY